MTAARSTDERLALLEKRALDGALRLNRTIQQLREVVAELRRVAEKTDTLRLTHGTESRLRRIDAELAGI